MSTPYLIPLHSPEATLAVAGGKGANLSRLIRAGFPVPLGFTVTTAAYDAFTTANGLRTFVETVLLGLAPDDPTVLEATSTAIRSGKPTIDVSTTAAGDDGDCNGQERG
jgi:pyruvate,water dikinase